MIINTCISFSFQLEKKKRNIAFTPELVFVAIFMDCFKIFLISFQELYSLNMFSFYTTGTVSSLI